ncbi:MAG: PAS domain S-box protein [Deltaproteobacteria bacterium]|nr:PAS domain S-box protein [Deltaproteobacteria bacterium]
MTNGVSVIIVACAVVMIVLVGMMLVLRRTNRRLQKQMNFWHDLLERTTAGILIVSSERRIIEVNRRLCEMYGYSRDELIGQSAEIFHLDRAQFERFGQWFDNARTAGPMVQIECQYRRKDGGTFWAVISGGPLVLPDGDMGVVWSLTDISDQKQAESELAIERSHMQTLFEVNGSGMLVVSSTRQILQVNDQFCNLFGYNRDELVGQSARVLHVDQQHYEEWAPRFQEAKAGFPIASVDYPWRRKDGSIFWCFFAGVKMELPSGESGVLWNVIDITERKQAEEKIKGQQDFLQKAIDALAHPFYVIDANDFTIKVANKASQFGEYREGATCFQLTHNRSEPCAGDDHPCSLREIRRTKHPVVIEHIHVDPAGKEICVEIHAYPIFDNNGNLSQIIEYCLDISERKQGEEERRRLVTAIEQGVDSVVITDPKGMIQYVNPSFERITGFSKDEVIGKNPRILQSGKHDAGFYQEMWRTLASGKAWQGHLINKKKDGTLFEEEVSITPVLNEVRKIINYVAVKRDVTGEMRLEEQLRQAQKMEAIGTLAGGIAHDFNNILAIILGYAELTLRETPETDPRRDKLGEIIKASTRAKDLVRQILDFSRKTERLRQPFLMAPLVKETLKMLRASIPATIAIEERITAVDSRVLGDPSQLHQVIINLCTNAFHAMEEQGGTLSITLDSVQLGREEAAGLGGGEGRYVRLIVADSGCGMSPIIQNRIFEPYFTTKGVGKGSGMGLAVVHGILRSHDGMVRLTSQEGKGTAFEVFLPAIEQPAKENVEKEGDSCPLGTERILMVDDEPAITEMFSQWLTRLGYTVTTSNNSIEALAMVRENPSGFDLIVTDQSMPFMPGSELAKEVLAIRPDLPIILCTGYSAILTEEKAMEIGIKRYAYKPLQGDELARLVREVLDGTGE